ncbi:MAG: Ig-like domain-containing protein [Bacteroidales bacterium]|nr:Ig-like domain-containing protein [Bacteroidales bacterium]
MKRIFLVLLVTCLLVGCSDDDKKDIIVQDERQLTQKAYADQTSGSSDVTFTTTGAWGWFVTQANVEDPNWVSITPDRGWADAGTHTISIVLDKNYTGVKRTALLTITCNDHSIIITIDQDAVTQTGEIPKPITDLTLDKKALVLTVGESETLTAIIDGTDKSVLWLSNNPDVATVDANGKVTAIAKGTAQIKATSNEDYSKTDICSVIVNGPIQGTLTFDGFTYNYESMQVKCGKATLGPGYYIQYTAFTTSSKYFTFSVYYDNKKTFPESGVYTVSFGQMTNNIVYDTGIAAPGLYVSLLSETQISVESSAGTIRISCNGRTGFDNLINFSYAGTYDLVIEPGMK